MATWKQLSVECLDAARNLKDFKYFRSSVSRSYYAAYCALTGKLPSGTCFPHGWSNPGHEQILKLIQNIPKISKDIRRKIIRDFRVLLHARQTADYRPGYYVDQCLVLDCIHRAADICEKMEVLS